MRTNPRHACLFQPMHMPPQSTQRLRACTSQGLLTTPDTPAGLVCALMHALNFNTMRNPYKLCSSSI
jgi:hypothetical protein